MTTVRNEQLIAKRRNLNLTQQEVANAVGISYRFYQNLEYGKFAPNVETAISIAKLLKCEVRDLFDNPRRQPGDDETQPDYSNSNSDGVEEVKELESAANDFDLDVDSILDIA
jgi:DNA-binding XRE family transcriptional regulator